jgi:large subunit ribosomal protein L17
MRKLKKGRKFSRKRDQRKALLKSLALALILKEKIKTAEAKAKELRSFLEKYINRAKNSDLATKRFLARIFPPSAVKKLTGEIGPRYKERKGGYTRIIKLGQRKTDGARMAIIELVK